MNQLLCRRHIIQYAFFLALSLVAACDKAGRQTGDDETEQQISRFRRRTQPQVAEELKGFRGERSQLLLLLEFFADAANNQDLVGARPVKLVIDEMGKVSKRPLDVQGQLLIVRGHLYRFIEAQPGHEIALVYSIESSRLSSSAFDNLTGLIERYLHDIGRFFGGRFDSHWLHVYISDKPGISYTFGPNLVLARDNEKFPIVVAHELVHVYNSEWTFSTPTFLTEGLAGLLSALITGTRLDQLTPSGKVHLQYKRYDGSKESMDEGTNGVLFLKALFDEIGIENFAQGVNDAYQTNPVTGEVILQSFKKFSPQLANIETLYRSWISDYIPAFAD